MCMAYSITAGCFGCGVTPSCHHRDGTFVLFDILSETLTCARQPEKSLGHGKQMHFKQIQKIVRASVDQLNLLTVTTKTCVILLVV